MIWTVPQKRRAIGWIGPLLVVLGLASPILAQDLASNRWSVTAAGALAYLHWDHVESAMYARVAGRRRKPD